MGLLVKDMIQSKYLKQEDLEEDEERVLTIKAVKLEDMPGDQGEQRYCLYFKEEAKGMVLNVTNIRIIERRYGGDTDEWVGNKIKLYVDPSVSFGGKIVGGLRIRVPKSGPVPQKAPPVAKPIATEPQEDVQAEDDFDDGDLPF